MSLRFISTDFDRYRKTERNPAGHPGAVVPRQRKYVSPVLQAVALLVLLLGAPTASAIDLEKLVMPGPLASAHADLESECSNCHRPFDRLSQRELCLDCHKDVATDVSSKQGFHGRNAGTLTAECRSCHPDHLGRDGDILGLSDSTFDHDESDFPLSGVHTSAACGDCHAVDVAPREAPSDCYACHEADDAHSGALSEDCGKCHNDAAWKKTKFNHDDTDFALTGQHADTACVGCHIAGRYEGTPSDCVSCHAIDDAHSGHFGTDCASCHQTAAWQDKDFDHKTESGFPLVGAHGKAECATCHRQVPGKRKLPEDCSSCHASEDVHAGRFGTDCESCHSPTGWSRSQFDHDKRTQFPLRGAHQKQKCESCHSGPTRSITATAPCVACHASDDVHLGSLGVECADCHDESSFQDRIAFDHDLTKFPLLGLHAMASCEQCHESHVFGLDDQSCFACHASDDVHKRSQGTSCNDCHTPNAWDVWQFDHDAQTDFSLHGAHDNLECAACHTKATGRGFQMPQSCADCHTSDDIHRGGFGKSCDNCHSFDAWSPATIRRR